MDKNWTPKKGEIVWIKVFSNWSQGAYIGLDYDKKNHLVRETHKGGVLLSSEQILPKSEDPNGIKTQFIKEEAKKLYKNNRELIDAYIKGATSLQAKEYWENLI